MENGSPVSVVRAIINNDEGKVLVLRRANSVYGDGGWCLPGGKVDYGMTVEEALVQELLEETALRCVQTRFLFYQDSLPLETGKMHCINLYFECAVQGEIVLNEESSAYAWVGQDEAVGYGLVFGNEEGVRRYWES